MSPRNTEAPPNGEHRGDRPATRSGVRRAAKAAVGSAAFAAGVLLLSGTAQATDDIAPETAPAPAPDPAGESLWIPASPAPEAVVNTPAPDPAPAVSLPTTEPAPTTQTDQTATVDSTGTGLGNTGSNTAVGNQTGGGVQADPCPTSGTQIALICTTSPTGAAGVTSGNANAQGTNSTGGIAQITNIAATGNGQVDVLQVALIINIGVGISNSGANAAGAAGGETLGAAGMAAIGTGNANVTGLLGNTQIVQGVTVIGGSASDQSVTVVNIGIGVGNSGSNLAAGSVVGGGQEVAAGGAPGNGSASVGTGNTNAVGDNSGSLIMQIVTVTAADDGSITVTQRAVIINFGLALANSGGNHALSGLYGVPDEQWTMIEGLIAALFGLDPVALFGSGGLAAIGTGNANAIGNQSQSGIAQAVTGSVTGSGAATADQSAWIGNFGAALANTGLNGAAGTVAVLPNGSPMSSAEDMVARFLALLANPDAIAMGNTEMADALKLGSALLDLRGDIRATETLAGLDEGEAWESSDGGVRIRQITGVLNIGISLANSGWNLAESVVTGSDLDTLVPSAAQVLGTASILTGPVDVLGLRSKVCVTQIIGDAADFDEACPAPTTPEEPEVPEVEVEGKQEVQPTAVPAALPIEVEEKAVQAGALPVTGSDSLPLQALFGLALTGGGILIQRRTKRVHADRTIQ